jgi:hypothetical protein
VFSRLIAPALNPMSLTGIICSIFALSDKSLHKLTHQSTPSGLLCPIHTPAGIMWNVLRFLICFLTTNFVLSAVIPSHTAILLSARNDVTFNCDCVDHWFRHEDVWIRADSRSGCMALETIPRHLWALNRLPKPDYVSKFYPNLVCSLTYGRCQWMTGPLDFPGEFPKYPCEDINADQTSATEASISTSGPLHRRQE